MDRHILYREEARISLMKGVEAAAKTVSVTLGPLSYNILLHTNDSTPQILGSGVAIINEIELENFFENVGVKLIRQASSKTSEVVGDGTTTTIVIAYSLIRYSMNYLIGGMNIIGITTGIQKAVEFLSNKLVEYAQPVNNMKTLEQIATIASGNNNHIGTIIAKIVDEIGPEGVISLEDSHSTNTTFKISQGIKIDRGLFSSAFVKKGDTMKVIQDHPYILITDKKITLVKEELIPILELVSGANRSLLILAEDLSAEVLSTLVINRVQNVVDVVAIRLPGFGHQRQLLLEDISTATNGKIISDKIGLKLDLLELSMLGIAKKVIIDRNSTTILLNDQQEYIDKHCNQLRKQINISSTIYEQENLRNRLARISSKTAIIKIGALSTDELQDKKTYFKEALNSVQAAVEEGIIPGGWSISIHLSLELLGWAKKYLPQDQLRGALLVKESFMTPLQRIIHNGGYNEAIILNELAQQNFKIGYDTINGSYVNMHTAGIIDSAKVMRLAIQNAASIAKMFLTTECVIINKSS
uniref:Chaperonin GroEL n=1 Tax=Hildenbrandia rubra TaxID=31481 RepID=A0A1C9CG70_9FLOR|nr:chaperonin GroEL [Hildenbrandia rubra]AOM67390.1 chaperonin GroEL [Hildenbrandia rubra]